MSDANRPGARPAAAAAPPSDAVSGAFDLLSSEGRLAIMWALWEVYDPAEEPAAIPFSELAERCAYDSPGNLSYHLDKLVGRYVQKTDDGYRLTGTGQQIVRAIRAGAVTRNVAFGPFEIDEPCPYCRGVVEVSYADNYVQARCTDCGGTYPESGPAAAFATPEAPDGVITRCSFPPAGVEQRGPGETLQAYLTRTAYRAFSMLAGTCPACAGRTRPSTAVCSTHEAGTEGCPTCGFRYAAQTLLVCSHCKLRVAAASRWLTLSDPRVGAYFHERGLDVRDGFSVELWSALDGADLTVHAREPLALEFHYPVAGDVLDVEVDGALSVTNVSG